MNRADKDLQPPEAQKHESCRLEQKRCVAGARAVVFGKHEGGGKELCDNQALKRTGGERGQQERLSLMDRLRFAKSRAMRPPPAA